MRRREPSEREGTAGDSSNKEVTGEIGADCCDRSKEPQAPVYGSGTTAKCGDVALGPSRHTATPPGRLAGLSKPASATCNGNSAFDVEVRNVATSGLGNFLLHYICCEALGKLLIGSAKNILPHQIFQRSSTVNIDLRSLGPAARRLAIPISDGALHIVFQRDMETAGQRSCRVLRNGVIHELRSDHVAEVNHRLPELTKHMAVFIEGVRVRSGA
jgi:hypothetical protein